VQRLMATTLMTNDQLGLKERREVRARADLSGHPCGMHAVLRGPQHCAVYNRLVLPDAEMSLGPLASATGATAPVEGRTHHLPGPDVYHLTCRMSCTHLSSLNQTSQSSHSSLSPLGSLKEPCQHTCLKHPYRTLDRIRRQNLGCPGATYSRDVGVLPTISSEEPFYPGAKSSLKNSAHNSALRHTER